MMTNTIDKELESFFESSNKQEKVVADPERFKEKNGQVGIPFNKLETAKDISNLTSIILSGMGVSGITAIGWISSLSVMAKLGLALSLISTPWGLFAIAGLSGAGLVWMANKALRSVDNKAYKKIPAFINSPLDLLGDQIYKNFSESIICVIGNESYSANESRKWIIEYFENCWGFDNHYLTTFYSELQKDKLKPDIDSLAAKLNRLTTTKDINLKPFVNEIITTIDKIINLNHIPRDPAIQRFEKLKICLKYDG